MLDGLIFFLILFIVFFCFIPFCCRKRRRYLQQLRMQNNMNRVQEVVVNGQRIVRVATVSTTRGQVSLDVYEVRLNSPNAVPSSALPSYEETPPPPFQTALQESTPVVRHETEEMPPPSYEDFMKVQTASLANHEAIVTNSENGSGNANTVIESNSSDNYDTSTTQRY